MTRSYTIRWHTFSNIEVEATYSLASDHSVMIETVVDGQGRDVDLSADEIEALTFKIENDLLDQHAETSIRNLGKAA